MAATATTTAETLPVLGDGHPAGHVAPQVGEDEIGAQVGQLGPAPGRAGGHEAAGRQARQRGSPPGRRGGRPGAAPRPRTRCGGMVEGMSLAECTAASARPSVTAASTSVTKTPWPPIWSSGDVASLVARGAHDDGLDLEARVGAAQELGDHLGLAQRQR